MGKVVMWRDFAVCLHCVRERSGLTQKELAERIGCGQMHVWKLEHGSSHPSKLVLHALQHELTLEPAEVTLFAAFEQMAEYHCEQLELEEG